MIKVQVSFGKVMNSSMGRKEGLHHYLGANGMDCVKDSNGSHNICFLLLYYRLLTKIIYMNICVSVCVCLCIEQRLRMET